jgi:hypothetical protein
MKGHQGPEGSFRGELMSVISWPRPSPEEIIKSTETAIGEMIKAGFGYGDFPMRELHMEAFQAYTKTERFTDALKCALRLYFDVDLLCVPAPFAKQRYKSAVALTSALNNSAQVPDDIKVFLPRISYYLRGQLILAAKKWCGEDSIIFKYERERFEEDVRTLYTQPPEVYAIGASNAARNNFAKNLNKLLAWAGVKPVTVKNNF